MIHAYTYTEKQNLKHPQPPTDNEEIVGLVAQPPRVTLPPAAPRPPEPEEVEGGPLQGFRGDGTVGLAGLQSWALMAFFGF